MRVIEIFLRNELVSEYFVSQNKIMIGREKWNDIILSEPSVSRKHAFISLESGKPVLTDISTGGTFLNGEKVSTMTFTTDDKIVIGPYSLIMREYREKQNKFDSQTIIHDRTLVIAPMDSRHVKSFLYHQAYLQVVKGADRGRLFRFNHEKVTFGKSKDNDLVLADEFVSRHHGEIYFRNGEFFMRDLGSKNGTSVNGKRVQGAILSPGSRIDLGNISMNFILSEDKDIAHHEQMDRLGEIFGKSAIMQNLYRLLKKAAACDATVLLLGETGTGKELAARTIHSLSSRSQKPFVTIDCGSIPRDLIESELFGHEKGAFTGAQSQRKGAFELGSGGTVFLDEIGELPRELQPKLLRILEEREFKRVGGDSHIPADVRIIAATNRNLTEEVKKGNFREELFFRLYVIPLSLPSLTERREDIPLIVNSFLNKNPMTAKKEKRAFSDEAMKKLVDYPWPGNVRELRNIIDRALFNCEGPVITTEDIKFIPSTSEKDDLSFKSSHASLEEVEKQTIINALKAQGGNKKATAAVLGIAYSTMCEKVKKYKIKI
jgi:DNA-binding NtrC family response regulator